MKKFKVLLALVFALAFTASAMAAATITWSGEAQVRYGYQGIWIDEDDSYAANVLATSEGSDASEDSFSYFGLKAETGLILRADIVANDNDKLTGGFEVEFQAVSEQMELTYDDVDPANPEDGSYNVELTETRRPIVVNSAWVAYDFGPVILTYNAANMQGRWDTSIQYIDDYSSGMSLDAKMPVNGLGYAFVTLMSDNAYSAVGYEDTELRTIPMVQAGFTYESDMIDATVGGVFDQPTEDGGDYTGYMVFGDAAYKMGGDIGRDVGSLRVGFSAVYGQNVSAFAGSDPNGLTYHMLTFGSATYGAPVAGGTIASNGDEDSTVMGARLHVAYTLWAGGILSYDARYSMVKLADGTFATALPAEAFDSEWVASIYQSISLTQAFDANMFVTLGLGYERYERTLADTSNAGVGVDFLDLDAAYGIEATVQAGYRF